MQKGGGATACLAEFITNTGFGDLSPKVVNDTKRIICDSIACAVGGSSIDAGKIVVEMARELGGRRQSTIMANGGKVSPASAAFANTYLGNALDADETLLHSFHHAVCAVFPAIAIAESQGLAGKDLITAVAIGYDIGARIGLSFALAQVTETGAVEYNPRRTLGLYTFAAMAAAGKTYNLDVSQLASAFGIAGHTCPIGSATKWAQFTSGKPMAKYSANAFQGFNGVVAAQMARMGFTGDTTFLDGDFGYWKLVGADDYNWGLLLGDLGKKWWISETSIKPYASGRYSHHSLDLFRKLIREQDLRPEEIERVEVKTFSRAASSWFGVLNEPKTQIDMQFSIPLALAAAAYGSELMPDWQSPEMLKDRRLSEFARKVRVDADPLTHKVMAEEIKRTGRFTRVPTQVTVLARGKPFSARSDYAWGDPWTEETRMTDEQLKNKFRGFCSRLLRSDKIEKALETLDHLEEVKNIGTELTPLLS